MIGGLVRGLVSIPFLRLGIVPIAVESAAAAAAAEGAPMEHLHDGVHHPTAHRMPGITASATRATPLFFRHGNLPVYFVRLADTAGNASLLRYSHVLLPGHFLQIARFTKTEAGHTRIAIAQHAGEHGPGAHLDVSGDAPPP